MGLSKFYKKYHNFTNTIYDKFNRSVMYPAFIWKKPDDHNFNPLNPVDVNVYIYRRSLSPGTIGDSARKKII